MRIIPFHLVACSMIIVIHPSQGYVSGVNSRLTTSEPTITIHEVTIAAHSNKQVQVRESDGERVIFPSSWSQDELVRSTDQRTRGSQGDHEVADRPETRGSFPNSVPLKHNSELMNSFPQNRNKQVQVRASDDERVIFPSSWSQDELVRSTDQRTRGSQGDHEVADRLETRGSFPNSVPLKHNSELKNSFPQNRNKQVQIRASDDERVIFPSSWSQDELVRSTDQRTRDSQGDHEVADRPQTRGSFPNSVPLKHNAELKNSFPQSRIFAYPFERDDDDDRPIWRD